MSFVGKEHLPGQTTEATAEAVAERFGVQGGGTNADPGATGRGGANTMTDSALRYAGGEAAAAGMRTGFGGTTADTAAAGGAQMRPTGATTGFGGTTTEAVGAGGPEMRPTAASTSFGGTAGTLDQPATGPMGGGRGMGEPLGAGAPGPGTAGTIFTGQGRTGDEAMGGGVMDPTPVDRKSGL